MRSPLRRRPNPPALLLLAPAAVVLALEAFLTACGNLALPWWAAIAVAVGASLVVLLLWVDAALPLGRLIWRRRHPRRLCVACGYDVTPFTGNTCPACHAAVTCPHCRHDLTDGVRVRCRACNAPRRCPACHTWLVSPPAGPCPACGARPPK